MCFNVHVNWPQMHMLRHVLGWGVGGSVSVHVNLPHMLRHVLGVCVCVFFNVHVTLPHMHMLRHVWVSPYGRSLVALWRSAWPRERRKTSREFLTSIFPVNCRRSSNMHKKFPDQ